MALNTSDNDLAMQLHFALFDGAAGFVLKPLVMCGVQQTMMEHRLPEDVEYWPAPGRQLHRTSIKFLSIHLCPKVHWLNPHTPICTKPPKEVLEPKKRLLFILWQLGERRPRYSGMCHSKSCRSS